MKQRLIVVSQLCMIVVLALVPTESTPAQAADDLRLNPVVVELFTSQGCSSCPPADALLETLTRNQPVAGALIIPLSEHVDYWNRLGWRDPFSSSRFSERQKTYVHQLQVGSLYTPMMVVDGHRVFVGSQSTTAREAIVSAAQTPKAELEISLVTGPTPQTVRVRILATAVPARNAREKTDVWLAVTEDSVHTEVTHGENAFRTLTHTGVVRFLERIGSLPIPTAEPVTTEGQVRLGPSWQHANLRIVAFLQNRRNHRIVGAAQVPLS